MHGREAGFRTHALVCVSSSLLMVLMVFQWELVPKEYLDTVRVDPSRMAQGIMTGIGFLGAGVIIKEGLTVRGLTTAASIWMTASIGIVIGKVFQRSADPCYAAQYRRNHTRGSWHGAGYIVEFQNRHHSGTKRNAGYKGNHRGNDHHCEFGGSIHFAGGVGRIELVGIGLVVQTGEHDISVVTSDKVSSAI